MANPTDRQVILEDAPGDQNTLPQGGDTSVQAPRVGSDKSTPASRPAEVAAKDGGDGGDAGDPLRLIRLDLLAVQDILNRVAGGTLSLDDYLGYLQKMNSRILQRVQGLPQIDETGETRENIRNAWRAVQDSPLFAGTTKSGDLTAENDGPAAAAQPGEKPKAQMGANDLPRQLSFLDGQLRKCLLAIARVTIPQDWNEWTQPQNRLTRSNGIPKKRQQAEMRSGDPLQFNVVFAQDLPNADDRSTLLAEFAGTPGILANGWIDVDQGLIYLYDPRPRALAGNTVVAILMLVVTGAVAFGASYLGAFVPGWPLTAEMRGNMLGAWLAVLTGVAAHVYFDVMKVSQAKGQAVPNISLYHVPLWIETHRGTLLLKLLSILVGLFFLVFTLGVQSPTTIVYGFFVGYSLDSIIGVANNALGQQSSAFVAMLKQKTGASSS